MKIEEVIKRTKTREGRVEMMETPGTIYRSFSGMAKKDVPGISFSDGSYNTTANGWCEYFHCSTLKEGERFAHEGREYVCIRNTYSRGDAYYPSRHTFMAIPVEG